MQTGQYQLTGTIQVGDKLYAFLKEVKSGKGLRAAQGDASARPGQPSARAFEATTEQGTIRGLASFVSHQGQTFALLGLAPAERFAANEAALRQTLGSFGPLADPAAAAVSPARVELVKVPRDMTLERFAAEYPSSVTLEVLAIVNEAQPADTLRAGATVKRIVGGPDGAAAARR